MIFAEMLDVGLIGLEAGWEERFRPVLLKLRNRLRVCAVYSAIAAQSEQIAPEFGCRAELGLRGLLERPELKAALIFGNSWCDGAPAEMACRLGKSVFLAASAGRSAGDEGRLSQLAEEKNVTIMPDFGHRYTPATSRLKELIATRLGPLREVVVELKFAERGDPDALWLSASLADLGACALDWCWHLFARSIAAISPGPDSTVILEFRAPSEGAANPLAKARWTDQPAMSSAQFQISEPGTKFINFRAEIRCVSGRATIEGTRRIQWETRDENGSEMLSAERTEAEVMLDHFTRRVIGGLIPLPALHDVCRGRQLAEAAQRALREHRRVEI
jgi:predicted dehydrogenase